jgi:lysozyme
VISTPPGLITLIQRFEGLRLRAYWCPAGILTCGWGSTGPDIGPATVWTREEADRRMLLDAQRFTLSAQRLCPRAEGTQLAALADFAYNLGTTRLASSTLRRKFNRGDIEGARAEFGRWVYAGGKKLPGLVLRRAAEAALL